jgi:hypothetical protein
LADLPVQTAQNSSYYLLQGETMKAGYLEQLKTDMAARFERDLRKPKSKSSKSEAKVSEKVSEEDQAQEQKKQDHFARLLMAEAVRELK